MTLQGSFKCCGWLNMSNFMRQRIPDRRSSMGKWMMSKCFGLYMWNAKSSWVRLGAELSWWTVDREKVRHKQGLYQRKRSDGSVDNLYSIHAWMGSQWRVLRRGETWSRLWAFRMSLAAEFWTFCSYCRGSPPWWWLFPCKDFGRMFNH